MRFLISSFTVVQFVLQGLLYAQDLNSTNQNSSSPPESIFPSDFFTGALDLSSVGSENDNAMGTQRLVDVKSSRLTPTLGASVGYSYTSNPSKVESSSTGYVQDGVSAQMNLSFNMGLGEYGLGEDVLATPTLMLMQMRTYNDPVKDYGSAQKVFDVDVQIAGFSVPFVLPNDFILTLGHSYVRPIAFRTKNIINYSNTPSLSFNKNFPLFWGDVLSFTAGVSYSFTEGDTLEEQLNDPEYYNFIKAVMEQSGSSPSSAYPSNLQDALTHTLSLAYIKQIGQKLTVSPSVVYSNTSYTAGSFLGRSDKTYNAGVNFSYPVVNWFNVSAAANYMKKESSEPGSDYNDFLGGVTFGVNYSF
jgi:hypothetical protein